MILIIFRIGSQVTVPGVNAGAIQNICNNRNFRIVVTFSGGALSNFIVLNGSFALYHRIHCCPIVTNGYSQRSLSGSNKGKLVVVN